MTNKINTLAEYLDSLPEERREIIEKLRKVIKENLPAGFEETISYGSIAYVVPLKIYPQGYHVQSNTPLPFIGLSNWKNHISFSHWGLYINQDLLAWFKDEYSRQAKYKLSMGKACVNLKRMNDIPYKLIGDLCGKIQVEDFIRMYERAFVKKG
jgi:hypothetical protein